MKTYAFTKDTSENESGFSELTEISIIASPQQLREMARFLTIAAQEIEDMGEDFDHVHFQDRSDLWDNTWLEVIVMK